jgi:hypothetical protein
MDEPSIRSAAQQLSIQADHLCKDGCGLSARACDALHEELVARVVARLTVTPNMSGDSAPWPKAA